MAWLGKIGFVFAAALSYIFAVITGVPTQQSPAPVHVVSTSDATTSSTAAGKPAAQTLMGWIPFAQSSSTLYSIKDGVVHYNKTTLLEALDASSLKISPDGHYVADDTHVFHDNHEVTYADPASFRILNDINGPTDFAKDSSHAYFQNNILLNADGASFEIIVDGKGIATGLAKDAHYVYWPPQILDQADPATFVPINTADGSWTGTAKDKKSFFRLADGSGSMSVMPLSQATINTTTPAKHPVKTPGEAPAAIGTSFSDWKWYPLGTHFNEQDDYYIPYNNVGGRIYFILEDRTATVVLASANSSSFQFMFSINEGVSLNYGRDASRVYYRFDTVAGADPQTFEPILDSNDARTYFGKDANAVYCGAHKVVGARVDTFAALVAYGGKPSIYGSDNLNVFYCDKQIVGADLATFSPYEQLRGQFVQIDYSLDKDHVYFEDHVIEGADPATFKTVDNQFSSTYTAEDKNHKYLLDKVVQ